MTLLSGISDSFRILPRAFGLDISDGGLKFVYIKKRGQEYAVHTFGERSFGRGIIEKGRVLDVRKLGEELRRAVEQQERRTGLPAHAVIGIPEEEAFIRVVQMPKMSDEDLAQAIRWEIEGNIPLPVENVYYAYQRIAAPKQSVDKGQKSLARELDHMDVLVAAAPKEVIDGYMKASELAGIQPLVVEPASVALARALVPLPNSSEDIVLIDLGAMHTRIVIYAKGALRFTSSIPLSLEDGIANIMREFSYDHGEAEHALYTFGFNRGALEGRLFDAVIPVFTDLKEQIEKYMNFQRTHREHEHSKDAIPFSSIIIAGGGALVPGIVDYFSQMFGLEVHVGNPLVNLPIRQKEEVPHIPYRDALRFAASIGLALRGALPPEDIEANNFYAS